MLTGTIGKVGNSTLTREEFTLLQKTANRIIKNIAKEIMTGNIEIKPVYNTKNKTTTCKYCEYSAICGFDSSSSHYEYVGNKSKEVILEEISKKT